jgi:hypothetical protein
MATTELCIYIMEEVPKWQLLVMFVQYTWKQSLESMPDYVSRPLEPCATVDIIEYMELHGLWSLLWLNIIAVQKKLMKDDAFQNNNM